MSKISDEIWREGKQHRLKMSKISDEIRRESEQQRITMNKISDEIRRTMLKDVFREIDLTSFDEEYEEDIKCNHSGCSNKDKK